MKINAICVVKNEGDIIEETLLNAMKFCHRIYVFDNWSTDGTWETIQDMANRFPQIEVAAHSDETFKNQLRNRVYNMYHHLYTEDDWWYILDGDEMLAESPAPRLRKAASKGKNAMHAWFAQFYFTNKDLENYDQEDKSLPVSQRRKHYRVNWREVRFFKNDPNQTWSEKVTGRIPPFTQDFDYNAPVCRHYAERTPEQISARNKLRMNNPYSFFHVKSKKHVKSWVKNANDMFVYDNDGQFNFPLSDKVAYYLKEAKFWLGWRWKNVKSLPSKVHNLCKSSRLSSL